MGHTWCLKKSWSHLGGQGPLQFDRQMERRTKFKESKTYLFVKLDKVWLELFLDVGGTEVVGELVVGVRLAGVCCWASLKLDGSETITIKGLDGKIKARAKYDMVITSAKGKSRTVKLQSRIDTADEVEYFLNGGILQYVLRQLAA